jgi:hypothetical protein
VFPTFDRGRPGGVAAPSRAWRCCEVLVSCVFRPAVGDRHLGILVAESSASIHLPGIVAPVVGRDLVLASVGGQFVGGGLSGVGGAA